MLMHSCISYMLVEMLNDMIIVVTTMDGKTGKSLMFSIKYTNLLTKDQTYGTYIHPVKTST